MKEALVKKMTIVIIIVVTFALFFAVVDVFFVPENWEYQLSKYGKHWKKCMPGPYCRWRWISNIDAKVFMGEQSVQLPLGRPETGGGKVNFKDESASMRVDFYFTIFDSYLATYKTADVLKMTINVGDDAIRSFLALFCVEAVNVLKTNVKLGWIAATKEPKPNETEPDVTKSDFYKALNSWGVKPSYFIIGDTDMPEAVIEQIKRRQKAATDIEVSKQNIEIAENVAKKALVDAEADRQVELLRATGVSEGMDKISIAMAKRIKELMTRNSMSEEAARNYVVALAKMDALKNSKQTTWLEGSPVAAQGAAFGAGFNSSNQVPGN